MGDTISVLYDPQNPSNSIQDTWFSKWAAPAILLAMSVSDLIGAAGFFLGAAIAPAIVSSLKNWPGFF